MLTNDAAQKQEAIQLFKEAVDAFDYNDFVEGDEPYELLEDSSVTPDARARFELILKKRAKECKVPAKTIDGILKARSGNIVYMPTQQENYTDWEGQPCILRTGKYITEDNRILTEDKFGMEIVCSHPIMPSRRFINIETGTESLEISFKREYWKTVVLDKGTLSNATSIVTLANHGVSVTSETAKALVKYIAYMDDLNRDLIPIEQMSSHLGWVANDMFVPYAEGIQYDGQGVFLQMFKTIHEEGSYSKWLDEVKSIRAEGYTQARLAMAAGFASVLLKRFDALPFFVHMWSAQSGTGKTVTMELAASIWADPQVGSYCRPIKSTNVGLEQLAIFTCNLPLCLDELQTIQKNREFDDIIYSLCEGSGKTRGARNGGLRQSPSWKNCIITTGEMPIVGSRSKAGAMNRVIELECAGKMMPDPLRTHRLVIANYGHAGRVFIEAIQKSDVWEAIKADQEEIFTRLSAFGTDKQALSASILLAADHAAESIIFQDGVRLTEKDILPYVRSKEDVDTGRRAHEYIMDWVAENRTGFITDENVEDFRGKPCLGCIDTDKKTGDATAIWIIGETFNRAMVDGGFSPDSYLSWAKGKNLIRTQPPHNKVKKRIPGSGIVTRCVCIVPGQEKPGIFEQMTVVEDADLPWKG